MLNENVFGNTKNLALSALSALAAILLLSGCNSKPDPESNTTNSYITNLDRRITEREETEKAREEGRKSMEEFDTALRDSTEQQRKRLKAAAVSYRMSNSHGVRIDTYVLKSGRAIICSTSVRGNSPAIMNCDGDVD